MPPEPRSSQPISQAVLASLPPCASVLGSKPLIAGLLILVSVAGLLTTGCAVPGEPTARHPITPEPVADLAARQRGNAVMLTFTLPRNSTDKQPLPSPPTVEIYRTELPMGAPASGRSVAQLVDTIPGSLLNTYLHDGHVEFAAPIESSALISNPGQQIVYRVRTRVSGKRASADSNAASVRAYLAPPPIDVLRAQVSESAIVLSWDAPSVPPGATPLAGYRVYRAEVDVSNSPATISAPPSKALPHAPLVLLGEMPQPEYRDTAFQLDHNYSYVVRSIASFGPDVVESSDSTPLFVAAKDVFPPSIPHGLETVVIPATTALGPYVELAWAIGLDPDLAGYAVYRSEQADMPGSRVPAELSLTPTFRDAAVLAGRRYWYRVAAVDRDGNESAQTDPVEAVVPGTP